MISSRVHEQHRKRVLLVEDDAAVRRSLQLLLSSRGYEVRAYPSADGLAHDPEAMRADCLLADLVLPDGNAIILLNELRAAGWSGPAILISGDLGEQWRPEALAAGYSAAFPKPLQDAVLLNCLASLTSPSSKPRED